MDHFATELSSFFKWLISSTMHVSVLICLILAIKAVIRHRLAVRWHYWLWLLLLVRMLMPWAPQSSFSVFTLISQARRSIVTEHITKVTPSAPVIDVTAKVTQDVTPRATVPSEGEEQVSFAGTTSQTAQTPASMPSLEIIGILSLLWLVVALALAVAALACNFKLWRIIRFQRPLTEGKILDTLEDCKAEMGIQTILGVIVTDKVKSPALFGVVRPRLLLPEGIIETLTQEELRYVFVHELAHLKRRDIYLGWLMVILQVLHWFNPLVWLAFYRMRADRELACDGLVLSRMHAGESERYGTTIVNLLRGFSQVQYVPGIAGILEDKSQLKRRITMIAQFKKGSYRWSTLAVVLLAVLGSVVLTNAQGVSQTEKKEPEVMAKEFVELLVKGQFSKAVEGFNATMKKALPADKLAETWRTTTGQAGLFKQQLGTRLEKFLGSEIVFVTCEFEKGPMDVKVVYDSDNKVTGLWFVPTPQKVLEEYRGKAKEKPQVTRRVMRTVKLSYDDGSSEGKKSIAGNGHAVLFEAPAEGAILKAVRIYGSRYGYPAPPKEDFHVWICDKDWKVIKDFPFPYARFTKGNPKWVTLRVAPTPVPENFIICAGFNPERTKGVYVHYDNSTSGNSFTGLPGRGSRVFNQGEWMIQAILSAPSAPAVAPTADLAADETVDLQELIDAARPGSVLTVPKGTYTRPVTVNKPLTLRGESSTECILAVTADIPALLIDSRGPVTIDSLTLKWQLATSEKSEGPAAALAVKDTTAVVQGCRFIAMGNFKRSPSAVRSIGFSQLTLSKCRFEGFEYTVCYLGGAEGNVTDCIVMNPGHCGISVFSGSKLNIARNIVTGSLYHGIRSTGGTILVKDNLVINNKNRGIYLGNRSARGRISNNVIMGNATGISAFARTDVQIENNLIANSTYAGLGTRDSCAIAVRNNIFQKNSRGIIAFAEAGKEQFSIGLNTFWANTNDIENVKAPGNSITIDPLFKNPGKGDFSLGADKLKTNKQGLANPSVFIPLWQTWTKLTTQSSADQSEQIYIVSFKPVGQFRPKTAKELLSAFNEKHPRGVRTHHYRMEVQADSLIGYICVDTLAGKQKVVTMLNQSDKLRLIAAKPARKKAY